MPFIYSTTEEINIKEAAKAVLIDHIKADFYADNPIAEMITNSERLDFSSMKDEEFEALIEEIKTLSTEVISYIERTRTS